MAYTPSYQYNTSPAPGYGSNTALGMVPGKIDVPNVAAQLGQQIPGLTDINSSIFGNLYSMSRGQIPAADQNFMQDQAAAAAVASGMPGTNVQPGTLMGNRSARDLGLMQLQLQQQAAQQYPGLVGAVSNTQTVPAALQTQIAAQNSENNAAPNPLQAQSYAQQLYDQHLQEARRGATISQLDSILASPAGGTGGFRVTGGGQGSANSGMPQVASMGSGVGGGTWSGSQTLGGSVPDYTSTGLMGSPSSVYAPGQAPTLAQSGSYGLPSWQDTSSLLMPPSYNFDYGTQGNQPVSQGQMYISPQSQQYTDAWNDPSSYDPATGNPYADVFGF